MYRRERLKTRKLQAVTAHHEDFEINEQWYGGNSLLPAQFEKLHKMVSLVRSKWLPLLVTVDHLDVHKSETLCNISRDTGFYVKTSLLLPQPQDFAKSLHFSVGLHLMTSRINIY
jgi:hypothetical protein